jgi:probable phosphoglycerate mutase
MSVTRICLVRHGETAWNAEGRVQGQLDVPLNTLGVAQARAVAGALADQSFQAIYSSDLTRVRQTAAPSVAHHGLPLALDARLRERHYGMFERLLYTEVRERYPLEYARFRDKDPDFDFGTGESLRAFFDRSIEVLGEIALRHHHQNVLVFTHGGVLDMAYRRAMALDQRASREFGIPNAGINWLNISAQDWVIERWADTGHLGDTRDELPG